MNIAITYYKDIPLKEEEYGSTVIKQSEALEVVIQKYGDAEYAQQVRDCFKRKIKCK